MLIWSAFPRLAPLDDIQNADISALIKKTLNLLNCRVLCWEMKILLYPQFKVYYRSLYDKHWTYALWDCGLLKIANVLHIFPCYLIIKLIKFHLIQQVLTVLGDVKTMSYLRLSSPYWNYYGCCSITTGMGKILLPFRILSLWHTLMFSCIAWSTCNILMYSLIYM